MAYSLYNAAVTPCVQQLGALAGIIDKAAAHCAANKIEIGPAARPVVSRHVLPRAPGPPGGRLRHEHRWPGSRRGIEGSPRRATQGNRTRLLWRPAQKGLRRSRARREGAGPDQPCAEQDWKRSTLFEAKRLKDVLDEPDKVPGSTIVVNARGEPYTRDGLDSVFDQLKRGLVDKKLIRAGLDVSRTTEVTG